MQPHKHDPMPGTEVAQRLDFWWFSLITGLDFSVSSLAKREEAVVSPGSLFSVVQ